MRGELQRDMDALPSKPAAIFCRASIRGVNVLLERRHQLRDRSRVELPRGRVESGAEPEGTELGASGERVHNSQLPTVRTLADQNGRTQPSPSW